MTRRDWMISVAMTAGAAVFPERSLTAKLASAGLESRMKTIEKASGGRLGVAVLDTRAGALFGYHADERFPMCSTFKILAVGAVLKRVDQGRESLKRVVHYTQSDILEWAPVTRLQVSTGMAVDGLCEAAITQSDNTAANLLLNTIGGPAGVTAFARSVGDQVTRLDRTEPSLNEATPGDPRDTSSPRAMAEDLRKLALGDVLSPTSRAQLVGWLVANQTGLQQLRAGFPATWRVGDKTGSGRNGTANDVAIVWAPRNPVIVSVFLTDATVDRAHQQTAIAQIGKAVAESMAN